ncbi:MAG: outer membrane protein [Acidobacteriota bacterium]
MRKQILVAAFWLVGIAFANAATDLAKRANDASPTFDWSGTYIGAHIGYGWGHSNFFDDQYNGRPPFFPPVSWGAASDGVIAGIQAGYNWQRGNTVFGVEGEIGLLGLTGAKLQPGTDPFGIPYDASGTIDDGWYGGLSIRLGYAFNRTLLYAKGGFVYSGAKLGFLDTCTTAPCGDGTINASQRVGFGYQLGGGVEYALTDNWTVKVEYLYLDFGSTTITGTGVLGSADGIVYSIDSDLSAHTVKVGVNYKF